MKPYKLSGFLDKWRRLSYYDDVDKWAAEQEKELSEFKQRYKNDPDYRQWANGVWEVESQARQKEWEENQWQS